MLFQGAADVTRKLSDQTIRLRYWLFGWCIIFIALIFGFQIYILVYEEAGQCWKAAPLTALIVAPIVSMTTIMIFLLIGVFRGYTDNDMKQAPALKGAEVLGDSLVR